MTRKRYIKLIMAMGISRNEARELAAVALADGMTYQDAYDCAQVTALAILWENTIKEIVPGAAFAIGMDGGVPFIDPLKRPADGFRADVLIADEWCTAPGALQSAEKFFGLDMSNDQEGTTCR